MDNHNIRCTAVMLAAGMGLRMGGDIRKQYLMLGGMPMFLHSIKTMQESPIITDVVVMVHKDDVEVVRGLLDKYGCSEKLRRIVVGGERRGFTRSPEDWNRLTGRATMFSYTTARDPSWISPRWNAFLRRCRERKPASPACPPRILSRSWTKTAT